jgi:hypothetical protein
LARPLGWVPGLRGRNRAPAHPRWALWSSRGEHSVIRRLGTYCHRENDELARERPQSRTRAKPPSGLDPETPPESWLPRDTSVDRLDETPDLPDASRDPPGVCSTTCSRTSLRGRLRPDQRATRRAHRIFIDSSTAGTQVTELTRREGATVGGRYVEVKGSRQSPRRWIFRLARRSERPGALGRHPTPPLRAPFLFACGVQLGRGIGAGELLDGGKHG